MNYDKCNRCPLINECSSDICALEYVNNNNGNTILNKDKRKKKTKKYNKERELKE